MEDNKGSLNIGVAGWLILRLGFLLLIYNDSRVRSSFALLPVPIIEFFYWEMDDYGLHNEYVVMSVEGLIVAWMFYGIYFYAYKTGPSSA